MPSGRSVTPSAAEGAGRFLAACILMDDHWRRVARRDTHWERQARAMLDQIRAHPQASPFSSELRLLEHFGAGNLAPDSAALRRTTLWRAIRRYQRAVARAFGRGRMAAMLLGPLGDLEGIDRSAHCGRQSYRDAVETGWLVLRADVEALDVRSPAIFGEQLVGVGDRRLAWWTLLALKRLLILRREAGPFRSVLEIGAGNGELARLMLTTGTASRYVIVDIPPALAVAQEVLLADLDPAELALFDPARTSIPDGARCAFLTPDQIGVIGQADLGLNIASFGEMTRADVRSYVALVKRIGCRQFVSINSRTAHPVVQSERIDESFYREVFAPELTVRTTAAWSRSLDLRLLPPADMDRGYQWLHFTMAPGAGR